MDWQRRIPSLSSNKKCDGLCRAVNTQTEALGVMNGKVDVALVGGHGQAVAPAPAGGNG